MALLFVTVATWGGERHLMKGTRTEQGYDNPFVTDNSRNLHDFFWYILLGTAALVFSVTWIANINDQLRGLHGTMV